MGHPYNPYLPSKEKADQMERYQLNPKMKEPSKMAFFRTVKEREFSGKLKSFQDRIEEGEDIELIIEEIEAMLPKLPEEVLSNEDLMISLLEIDHNAYEYISKKLKARRDFNREAILRNENIFLHLTIAQMNDQEIAEAYERSRMNHAQRLKMGEAEYIVAPKFRIDSRAPREVVFNNQKYMEAYEYVLRNGPYTKDHSLSAAYAYVLEFQKYRGETLAQQLQRDVIKKNQEAILELASRKLQISDPRTNAVLNAVKERCPEIAPVIDERQRGLYEKNMQRIALLKANLDRGLQLTQNERAEIVEARKHIDPQKLEIMERRILAVEVQKQAAENLKKMAQKNQQMEMAYFRADAISAIRAASDIGAIDMGMEAIQVGRAESLPTIAASCRAFTVLQRCGDITNDQHNKEFGKENDGTVKDIDVVREERKEEVIHELLNDFVSMKYTYETAEQYYELADPQGKQMEQERQKDSPYFSYAAERTMERVLNYQNTES